MRLADLQPKFLKHVDDSRIEQVDAITGADGIRFLCPKCFADKGGPVGTHSVICWRPQVPATMPPGPGRWEFTGSGIDDLTLVAGSSSVQLLGGCDAHFFVRAGAIVPA